MVKKSITITITIQKWSFFFKQTREFLLKKMYFYKEKKHQTIDNQYINYKK